MGIIYTPNIPKHWFTDSLHDSQNFSEVMTYDNIHLLQQFLHFSGKENSHYYPNDGKRGCCHQDILFTDMKLCRKLCYPKKQLSVGKSLALFKCQIHFKQYIKIKRF